MIGTTRTGKLINQENLQEVEKLLCERIEQSILVFEDTYPMTAEDLEDVYDLWRELKEEPKQ